MIYADTGFFVALVTNDDGLQGRAEAIARDHERDIHTSQPTVFGVADDLGAVRIRSDGGAQLRP